MADQYITPAADKPWHRLMARAVLGKPEADPRLLHRPAPEMLHIRQIGFANGDDVAIMNALSPSEIDLYIDGVFKGLEDQGKAICLLQSIPAVAKGKKPLFDALQEIIDKAAEYDRDRKSVV